jgi:hypothetical protein
MEHVYVDIYVCVCVYSHGCVNTRLVVVSYRINGICVYVCVSVGV